MESLQREHGNSPVLLLLRYIRERRVDRLEPTFYANKGISYDELSEFNVGDQNKALTMLVREGIAVPETTGSVLQCVPCGSFQFHNSYHCAFCMSTDIVKGGVIKHNKCNNIDFDYQFKSDNGELMCRKCNGALKALGVDYSRQGDFFKCLKCNSMTPNIDISYTCSNCGKSHSEDQLQIFRLLAYSIDQMKLEEFLGESNHWLLLADQLRNLGINCNYRDSIVGKSNVKHTFSLVVYGEPSASEVQDQVPVVVIDAIDQSLDDNNSQTVILSMVAKCIDIDVFNRILISIPGLNAEGKSYASMYGINLIEAQTWSEAKEKLIGSIKYTLHEFEQARNHEFEQARNHEFEQARNPVNIINNLTTSENDSQQD